MKKKLLVKVEIDCGRKLCEGCDYNDGGYCYLFGKGLEVEIRKDGFADYIRCPECLEAEKAERRQKGK